MKNHKEILRQKVLKHGWQDVAEMVGGFDILYKHAFNNDYNEFLNLFNNLEVVQSEKRPNWIIYRFEQGDSMMAYDKKNEGVYIDYEVIWSFFQRGIGINYNVTQVIMKTWLGEDYNLRGVTPCFWSIHGKKWLGEDYNLRGVIPTATDCNSDCELGESTI
jgi:hypothetical protein